MSLNRNLIGITASAAAAGSIDGDSLSLTFDPTRILSQKKARPSKRRVAANLNDEGRKSKMKKPMKGVRKGILEMIDDVIDDIFDECENEMGSEALLAVVEESGITDIKELKLAIRKLTEHTHSGIIAANFPGYSELAGTIRGFIMSALKTGGVSMLEEDVE